MIIGIGFDIVEVGRFSDKTSDDAFLNRLFTDRERELYVAMTRARDHLTFLHDPADARPMTELNPAIADLFESATGTTYSDGVTDWEWTP